MKGKGRIFWQDWKDKLFIFLFDWLLSLILDISDTLLVTGLKFLYAIGMQLTILVIAK